MTIVRLVNVIEFFDGSEGIANLNLYESAAKRVEYAYWAAIEIMTAIMCANLPAMSAFLRYFSYDQGSSGKTSAGETGMKRPPGTSPSYSSSWSSSQALLRRWFVNSVSRTFRSPTSIFSTHRSDGSEKSGSKPEINHSNNGDGYVFRSAGSSDGGSASRTEVSEKKKYNFNTRAESIDLGENGAFRPTGNRALGQDSPYLNHIFIPESTYATGTAGPIRTNLSSDDANRTRSTNHDFHLATLTQWQYDDERMNPDAFAKYHAPPTSPSSVTKAAAATQISPNTSAPANAERESRQQRADSNLTWQHDRQRVDVRQIAKQPVITTSFPTHPAAAAAAPPPTKPSTAPLSASSPSTIYPYPSDATTATRTICTSPDVDVNVNTGNRQRQGSVTSLAATAMAPTTVDPGMRYPLKLREQQQRGVIYRTDRVDVESMAV